LPSFFLIVSTTTNDENQAKHRKKTTQSKHQPTREGASDVVRFCFVEKDCDEFFDTHSTHQYTTRHSLNTYTLNTYTLITQTLQPRREFLSIGLRGIPFLREITQIEQQFSNSKKMTTVFVHFTTESNITDDGSRVVIEIDLSVV
jgi:hypothetical protein